MFETVFKQILGYGFRYPAKKIFILAFQSFIITWFLSQCINKAWQLRTAQAFPFGKLVCSKLIS